MEQVELADHDQRVAGRGHDHANGRSVVDEKTNAPEASLCEAKRRGRCSGCRWCAPEFEEGSISRRERQQTSLPWDPDLEEAAEQPPHLILFVPCLGVHRKRRRRLLSSNRQPI